MPPEGRARGMGRHTGNGRLDVPLTAPPVAEDNVRRTVGAPTPSLDINSWDRREGWSRGRGHSLGPEGCRGRRPSALDESRWRREGSVAAVAAASGVCRGTGDHGGDVCLGLWRGVTRPFPSSRK